MPGLENKLIEAFFWNLVCSHVSQHNVLAQSDTSCAPSRDPISSLDLTCLETLLDEHRLNLIVYPFLKKYFSQDSFLPKLYEKNKAAIAHHLHQKKTLIQIAEQFEAKKIAYVILKGPALNDLLYDAYCLRQSHDIDILISPKNAMAAHEALQHISFFIADLTHQKNLGPLKENFFHQKKDVIYTNTNDIILELHYRVDLSFHIDISLDTVRMTRIALLPYRYVNILSSEENFLYLCQHGAKHHWARLQWLVDLAIFVQKVPINWSKVKNFANAMHCDRSLFGLKILLQEKFAISLPHLPISWWDRCIVQLHLLFVRTQWKRIGIKKTPFHRGLRSLLIDPLLYPTWRQKLSFFYQRMKQKTYVLL